MLKITSKLIVRIKMSKKVIMLDSKIIKKNKITIYNVCRF